MAQKCQRFLIDSKYHNRRFELAAVERQEVVIHLKLFRFVAALAVAYRYRRF